MAKNEVLKFAKGQKEGKLVKKIQRENHQRGRKTKHGHVREQRERELKEKEFTQDTYT